MSQEKKYSLREEKANYLTHGLGFIIAAVATGVLIHKALVADNGWALVAFSIYGFGMLACMLSSTLYHYVREPRKKAFLRHFDHGTIYVLIAASYSPLTLLLLRNEGGWGWILFGLVWFFALIGIVLSFRPLKENNHLKTASYVLMGLTLLVAVKPLINVTTLLGSVEVLYWVGAGGLFYIIGSICYALARREFVHTVFHVFVLLGFACHLVATFLIPI